MKKTATKKVVKPVVKKATKSVKKVELNKGYHIVLKFNDQVHDFYSVNLEEAILSVKPIFLKTKLMVKIEKDGKVCERQFFGFRAKQFFRNKLFLQIFLKKIFFK